MEHEKSKHDSTIFAKIMVSFFLVIMTMGIGIVNFLRIRLQVILENQGLENDVISDIISNYLILSSLTTIIAIILSLSIAYYISRNIIEPLQILKKAADSISSGNYDVEIDIKTKDEIGSLAKSFDYMKMKLKKDKENMQKEVDHRTVELSKKVSILEQFRKLTTGSELFAEKMRHEAEKFKKENQTLEKENKKLLNQIKRFKKI